MSSALHQVTAVALPRQSAVSTAYASVNLADAFSVPLPAHASADPEVLARFIFARQPAWVNALMGLGDAIVAGLGLKTARQLRPLEAQDRSARVGIFRIYERTATEIVMGEDDKHLDFRVSVLCDPQASPPGQRRLVLSTVVHCHNRLGRAYIALIAPFHRAVVQASLRRAARAGWP
jgi:hypothetical protein